MIFSLTPQPSSCGASVRILRRGAVGSVGNRSFILRTTARFLHTATTERRNRLPVTSRQSQVERRAEAAVRQREGVAKDHQVVLPEMHHSTSLAEKGDGTEVIDGHALTNAEDQGRGEHHEGQGPSFASVGGLTRRVRGFG